LIRPFLRRVGRTGGAGRASGRGIQVRRHGHDKPVQDLIVHKGKVRKGPSRRHAILREGRDRDRPISPSTYGNAYSHATLRSVLGEHVKQAGSLVSPERLRFDFTHYTALTEREKDRIEELVNERILENHPWTPRSWTSTRPLPPAPWRSLMRNTATRSGGHGEGLSKSSAADPYPRERGISVCSRSFPRPASRQGFAGSRRLQDDVRIGSKKRKRRTFRDRPGAEGI